jgi:hypothetical protein
MKIRSSYTKSVALVFIAALVTCVAPNAVFAQDAMQGMDMSAPSVSIGASAIGLFTRVSPALLGKPLSEGYLTQPVLMFHGSALRDHIALFATLNGEGLTLRRGELDPGIWGEGYIDRRHPHTYLHELLASASTELFGTPASLAAGKGFPAFGTDDPMVRPFAKYPVNHHLAQILERYVLIGGVQRGAFMLEGSLFNGDEPANPADFPNLPHFGDSWSARVTAKPAAHIETQISHAFVNSPEDERGNGLDQRKWSASMRYGEPRDLSARPYAMAEWARTQNTRAGGTIFSFRSVLLEAAGQRGRIEAGVRYEDTDRPEEERSLGDFRSQRPSTDFSILGITRFQVVTSVVRFHALRLGTLKADPFLEIERAHVGKRVRLAAFDPVAFYGSDNITSLSVGLRLEVGAMHGRMGRYGVAATDHVMSHRH